MTILRAVAEYDQALNMFNHAEDEWVDVAALRLEAARISLNNVIKEAKRNDNRTAV